MLGVRSVYGRRRRERLAVVLAAGSSARCFAGEGGL
jgi:hypothetical protein